MKAHIEFQTIMKNGKPAFAVVPYEDFLKILPELKNADTIPHKVVQAVIKKNMSHIHAWREYLGLTQKEIATRMGISQAAFSQIESQKSRIRKTTLEKVAKALGITYEQLR